MISRMRMAMEQRLDKRVRGDKTVDRGLVKLADKIFKPKKESADIMLMIGLAWDMDRVRFEEFVDDMNESFKEYCMERFKDLKRGVK